MYGGNWELGGNEAMWPRENEPNLEMQIMPMAVNFDGRGFNRARQQRHSGVHTLP